MSEPTTDERPRRADAGELRLLDTLRQLLAIEGTTVKATLEQTSELVGAALAADKVDSFLYQAASDSLVAVGTSDTPLSRHQKSCGLDRLPLANQGRAVEVFRTGATYRNNDLGADLGELVGIRETLGIQSQMLVALDVAGRRRGVLQVSAAARDQYSEADQRFLEAVAQSVAMMIHRAELIEEQTRDATRRGRQGAAEELLLVLAHDLRNHLAALSLRVRLLGQRATQDGRAQDTGDLGRVRQTLQRLEQMVANLLDVERIERGLFALTRAQVDLLALIEQTVALLSTPDAPVRVQARETLVAEVDDQAIRQVLENLVSNALKHSPPRCPVTIKLVREIHAGADMAVIRVADSGAGIEPEVQLRLFDRFVAGPASSGLGLGLYLARGLVEAHCGALIVESSGAAGTVFNFSLPLRAPGHRAPVSQQGDGPPG